MSSPVLQVKDLKVTFSTDQGSVQAVRGVSFHVNPGEILGIVGESGSGKSAAMYAVMGLLAENARSEATEILFDSKPMHASFFASPRDYQREMSKIRGNGISMIFQDPMSFLNPVLNISRQLTEPILNHTKLTKRQARQKAIALLEKVGIPSPETRMGHYPHEFSGGMRQRIIIAMALANSPRLIIADEPTTALDVTIQAQILDLIRESVSGESASAILITHDLGVVASLCDRVAIMYAGMVMEEGTDREIFYDPRHPYTRGLLGCVNNPNLASQELSPIPGSPPDLISPPAGCPFVDRCESAMGVCKAMPAPRVTASETHAFSCWLPEAERRGLAKPRQEAMRP